uniref:Uncharacterized protein n=1 Tax=Arundo donax TaxID=35708 RepID=A0A0A9FPC9_ARUDO
MRSLYDVVLLGACLEIFKPFTELLTTLPTMFALGISQVHFGG